MANLKKNLRDALGREDKVMLVWHINHERGKVLQYRDPNIKDAPIVDHFPLNDEYNNTFYETNKPYAEQLLDTGAFSLVSPNELACFRLVRGSRARVVHKAKKMLVDSLGNPIIDQYKNCPVWGYAEDQEKVLEEAKVEKEKPIKNKDKSSAQIAAVTPEDDNDLDI